jgi:predicted metalloendopeptidase
VAGVLATAGGENPDDQVLAAQADEIIALERSLAVIASKDEDRSDTVRMYNPFQIKEYQVLTDTYANLGDLGVRLLKKYTPCSAPGAQACRKTSSTLLHFQALNWKAFLDQVFSSSGVTVADEDIIIVLEMNYIQNLTKILADSSPKIVANYVQFRYVNSLAGETTQDMRDISFKFNQFLTGAKEPPTR